MKGRHETKGNGLVCTRRGARHHEQPQTRMTGSPAVSDEEVVDLRLLHLVSEDLARRYRVAPLRMDHDGALEMITPRPDLQTERLLALTSGVPVRLRAAPTEAVERILACYGRIAAISAGDRQSADQKGWAPGVLDAIITGARRARASDVHLQPGSEEIIVRYRIDGVLHDAGSFPATQHRTVLNRIRVLAGISLADCADPQSGQITFTGPEDDEVDLRVSVMPGKGGPKVVLRILDRSLLHHSLEDLGFTSEALERYQRSIVSKPYGMVLIAGPTGSGKTTTLYNTVLEMDRVSANVVTLEDPVEYALPRTTQVQVDNRGGLSFASALSLCLRQDPDVIIVGEIRDPETATVALQAALTGHKVFSSIHAMDAISALYRLLEMGVEPYLLPDAVSGVVAQRLVRRVCPECREACVPHNEEHQIFRKAGFSGEMPRTLVRRTSGCYACAGTGYAGRTGIFEVLPLNREIGSLIAGGASRPNALRRVVDHGLGTLLGAALQKVVSGVTSMEEVMRVIHG